MSPASILAAAAMVVAPGAGLSLLAFRPERSSLATQLGLAVPLGFAWVGAGAFVLALAHVLTLPSFLVLYLAGTVAAWFGVARTGGLRARWRAWAGEVLAEPWASGVAFAV